MSISMGANCPETRLVPIGSLKPYEGHARHHNRHQRRKLEKLIRHYGQIGAVIVDDHSVIVDGHAVWGVMRALGYDEINVFVVSSRHDVDIKALRLALNRLPTESGWDTPKLRNELQELSELSFDMELTAFSAVEIDYLLETDEIDPEPIVPKPDAVAISRLGDIWCLDHHRVGCGDALQVRFVDEVLGGVKLSVAFIDPPYNIPIDGFASGNGAIRHRDFAMASGEMSEGQFTGFLAQALSVLRSHLKAGSPLYVFMDWRHIFELLSAARSIGLELLNLCVWAKTTPGLGSFYRSQHELVAIFKAGEGELRNNLALSGKRRNRSNLWTYRGLNSFGDDRDELVKLHPTVKPVALIGDALRDVTMRGDAVIDTFLGSGSTLMAAEETGRTCFGIELDPLYIDVAIRRWQDATRKDAILLETGETFGEVMQRRHAIAAEGEASHG